MGVSIFEIGEGGAGKLVGIATDQPADEATIAGVPVQPGQRLLAFAAEIGAGIRSIADHLGEDSHPEVADMAMHDRCDRLKPPVGPFQPVGILCRHCGQVALQPCGAVALDHPGSVCIPDSPGPDGWCLDHRVGSLRFGQFGEEPGHDIVVVGHPRLSISGCAHFGRRSMTTPFSFRITGQGVAFWL